MIDEETRSRLSAIRESGDLERLAVALVDLAEVTPLFNNRARLVGDWIAESRQLSEHCVVDAAIGTRQSLRQAEVLLVLGQPAPALALARRAEAQAKAIAEMGLEDASRAVASRALVRLGQHQDALELMQHISTRSVHPLLDAPRAPGLCFLAVGEAYMREGCLQYAKMPLQETIKSLQAVPASERLLWDTHMALAVVAAREREPDVMSTHLQAASEIATHAQAQEASASTWLLQATFARTSGAEPAEAFLAALRSTGTASLPPRSPWTEQSYILDRLLAFSGGRSYDEFLTRAGQQAAQCGKARDLLGYILFVALASAVRDASGARAAAKQLLVDISGRLSGQDQPAAAELLGWYATFL